MFGSSLPLEIVTSPRYELGMCWLGTGMKEA